MAAMVTVTTVYVVVAVAALGAQPWDFEGQEAGLATILDRVTSAHYWGTVLAAGAVISIFSVTLVVPTGRPESCSPWAGTVSCPAVRQGPPNRMTPVNNTVIVAVVVSILAGFVPLNYLADMVSIGTLVAFIVVSVGVVILRVREPDLPRGIQGALYPVTPVLSVLACGYILFSLHWYTWLAFSGWVVVVLVFYFVWGRHHSALNGDGDDRVTPSDADDRDVPAGREH